MADSPIKLNVDTEGITKPITKLIEAVSNAIGTVHSSIIRDLRGTVDREKAAIGVLIPLDPPTRDMKTESLSAGFCSSPA